MARREHEAPETQLAQLHPRWQWERGAFRAGQWTITRCADGSFALWVEGSPCCTSGWDLKDLADRADRLDGIRQNTEAHMVDRSYLFATCSGCGQRWQSIDWGCARHLLTCDPTPPQPQDPSAWSVES